MALKQLFFSKNYKKSFSGWGLCILTLVFDTFVFCEFTLRVSQFRHFHFLTIGVSSFPLAKSWLSAIPGQGVWSSILRYLCSTKSSSFENFRWRHCMRFLICPPPHQKFSQRLCPKVLELLYLLQCHLFIHFQQALIRVSWKMKYLFLWYLFSFRRCHIKLQSYYYFMVVRLCIRKQSWKQQAWPISAPLTLGKSSNITLRCEIHLKMQNPRCFSKFLYRIKMKI